MEAFQIEAMGAHYISDLFSAGHVRVPRTELEAVCGGGMAGGLMSGHGLESRLPGGVPAAGFLTKMMHDEDCLQGVTLTGIGAGSWTSYGDSAYFNAEGNENANRVVLAVIDGLEAVLHSFLAGLSGKALEWHMTPEPRIPQVAQVQRYAPLFKVGAATKPGKIISLEMRTSMADAEKPTYIQIDEDCSGISVECRTCADSIEAAESAKTKAKADAKARQPTLQKTTARRSGLRTRRVSACDIGPSSSHSFFLCVR